MEAIELTDLHTEQRRKRREGKILWVNRRLRGLPLDWRALRAREGGTSDPEDHKRHRDERYSRL
jgi:hypothetical protein